MSNLTPKALPALASEINVEHEAAERAINDALIHARNAGRLLIEAKAQVPFGEWGVWVDRNFAGSYRTARKYMRIADQWEEVQAKWPSAANLTIDGALALIAEPRESNEEPEPAVPTEPAPAPVAHDLPRPAPMSEPEAPQRELSKTEQLRQMREAQADGSAAFDVPEPEATPRTVRNDRVPERRAYTYRLQDLIRAATEAGDADDDEIAGIPTNDLMVRGIQNAIDLLGRIVSHHNSKRRNHVSA